MDPGERVVRLVPKHHGVRVRTDRCARRHYKSVPIHCDRKDSARESGGSLEMHICDAPLMHSQVRRPTPRVLNSDVLTLDDQRTTVPTFVTCHDKISP